MKDMSVIKSNRDRHIFDLQSELNCVIIVFIYFNY